MALTVAGKVIIIGLAAAALGGGYFYWKSHHVATPQVDVGTPVQQDAAPTPAPAPETVAPAETPTQPPVQVQPATDAPAPSSDDASANRGMKFLLNQGQGK
jgi:hypothetical protein